MIPEDDFQLLETSGRSEVHSYIRPNHIFKKWCDFNIALNNELVKIRASRRHVDPGRYLRVSSYTGSELAHIVSSAHRNPSLVEAEKILDQARWNFLDELALSHYFDFEALFIYLQKLRILERWLRINKADKHALEATVLVEN